MPKGKLNSIHSHRIPLTKAWRISSQRNPRYIHHSIPVASKRGSTTLTIIFNVRFKTFSYLCVREVWHKVTNKIGSMRPVRPKKFLGQHFLTDLSIAQDIADTVDACPDLPILEVGPGMGVMTQYLLRKPRPLKVVELDSESVTYLRKQYPELEEDIIEDDFLKMHLERTFGGRPFVLTGNYPYNISSQIFFKMLDYKDLIPCCTGMIQKEVAERIAAHPGSKTYGILSVLIQAWYSVEYLFTVHEHVFNPPPKVKSAVIRMTRNQVASLGCDEKLFRRVVKTTFNQRRKTLRNNIRPLLCERGLEGAPFLQDELFNQRPEQLSVQQFIELTNLITDYEKKLH